MSLRSKLRSPRARILFVTGASGFLGRHLVNGPASADWEIIAPTSTSLDLRNRDAVLDTVRDWQPTAVAHLAYRKADRRSIVDASQHVAEAAAASGARLVHMSSDVIFPGRPTPYVETDEPFPLIDYARDKLDAERVVIGALPRRRHDPHVAHLRHGHVVRVATGHRRRDQRPNRRRVLHRRGALPGARRGRRRGRDATRGDARHLGPLHVAGPDALSRAEFAMRTARFLGLNPSLVSTATLAESGLVRPGRGRARLEPSRRPIRCGIRLPRPTVVD